MRTIFLFSIIFFPLALHSNTPNIFDVIDEEQIESLEINPEQETIDKDSLNYTIEEDDIKNLNYDSSMHKEISHNLATIRILNKIFVKNTIISLKIGSSINFDNLILKVKACIESENPIFDSKALIEIQSEDNKFYSWIFANDPAIAVFEHPIYNVTLVRCKNS